MQPGAGAREGDLRSLHPVGRLPSDWEAYFSRLGMPPFRGRQVFRWVHGRGVTDPALMTDLPLALRRHLEAEVLGEPARVAEVRASRDGSRKLLLDLDRGGRVECVLIPMTRGDEPAADADAAAAEDDDDADAAPQRPGSRRVTLCVSTQVGCAMGCVFCASGQAGLERGLDAAEIVSQVLIARRHLVPGEELRNLVFMGMGEPLHHYDATLRALKLLTHGEGGGISPRRITVSTVGLVPKIRRLGEDFDGKVGLAVSLHAPTDALRDRIIPMNRKYPLGELIRALREYPLPRRRRITIEYTLIGGWNDGPEHAAALVRLLSGLRVKVNLIPMNPIAASDLRAPAPARVDAFRESLARRGLSCFVRRRRGDDVDAACGQLALSKEPALVDAANIARRT